jgi:tRNA pseudouridine55 synthase
MARRNKGRRVDGWLIIDKPAGITSTAVVTRVRRALGAAKAGHAGTLDPAATGVLAVALGEATKTVPFVTDALKAYRFGVRWGARTTTDDAEGETIAVSAARPAPEVIRAALPAFRGEVMQVPPQVSAVKIDGERAYALARDGQAPEIAPRPLWVESLELVATPDPDTAVFDMICGKGGYVRAFARDIGEALGCHGHVTELRRLWSGPFEPGDGIDLATLDRLAHSRELDRHVLPVAAGLHDVPCLPVAPEAAARLRNGNPAPVLAAPDVGFGDTAWAALDGRPVALGTYRAGQLHPTRVFTPDGPAGLPGR